MLNSCMFLSFALSEKEEKSFSLFRNNSKYSVYFFFLVLFFFCFISVV